MNLVRSVVSGHRSRFQDGEVDLDLSYITKRVAAMGLPSSGVEGQYRNHVNAVSRMLNKYHANHYMIWNLSQKTYDYKKFNDQVLDFGWPDHHPPPLDLIFQCCQSMAGWLKADPENTAFVHCKAGKGRTGTIICCFLLYTNACESTAEALEYFARRRSMKKFHSGGVTVPSQRRYVEYFRRVLHGFVPAQHTITLSRIILTGIPNWDGCGGSRPYVKIMTLNQKGVLKEVFSSKKAAVPYNPGDMMRVFVVNVELQGDVIVRFKHKSALGGPMSPDMFRFGFHTGFLPMDGVLRLTKAQLDDGCKDERLSDDLIVDVIFEQPRGAVQKSPAPMPWDSILKQRMLSLPQVIKYDDRGELKESKSPSSPASRASVLSSSPSVSMSMSSLGSSPPFSPSAFSPSAFSPSPSPSPSPFGPSSPSSPALLTPSSSFQLELLDANHCPSNSTNSTNSTNSNNSDNGSSSASSRSSMINDGSSSGSESDGSSLSDLPQSPSSSSISACEEEKQVDGER